MAAPTNDRNDTVDDGTMASLIKQYENTKLYDVNKAALVDEIVARYQYVSERLIQERADFDSERKCAEHNLEQSQANNRQLQSILDADPFVLVLIDGADLIFRNSFLRDGDNGGRRCATSLFREINEYMFSSIDDLPPETNVVVRIYIDLEELTSACLQANIIDQASKIRGFVRGFVQDRSLFDVVNVYDKGRETIIDKVEAQIKHHLIDFHCRQIIVGCSDVDMYPRILQDMARDEDTHVRITLLSGVPFHDNFEKLPFEKHRMPDVFRNTTIDKTRDHISAFEPKMPVNIFPSVIGTPFGLMTPPVSMRTTPSLRSDSRLGAFQSEAKSEMQPRTMSLSSSSTSVENTVPKPMTWASLANKTKAAPVTMSATLLKKEPPVPIIRRNKLGQRLDPPPPEYKKDEVNRLKKMKLCNAYYLRHDCTYEDDKCSHDHFYKCTKSEIETLKLVARMSCCIYGSECSDEACIYGHNCPFPQAKEGSMRGKGCLNGDGCRFPSHMHGMDMNPVRFTKIT